MAVRDDKTAAVERIDLPMRACAGGYYANLMRMYRHLDVPLHPVRFLFVFARALLPRPAEALGPDDAGSAPGSYFVHAYNLHQTPPPWPASRGAVAHVVEVLYLIICHFWFTVACFLVPPRTMTATTTGETKTLADYLQRTWLPRRYVSHYLLPLMSSVSTCSHADLLALPASDVVGYKRRSHGQQHYAVCGGVHQVQSRLARWMHDVRLGSRVTSVEPAGRGRVLVRWQSTNGWAVAEQPFDRAVLAVSPDVGGRIFLPLASTLDKFPTRRIESSVLSPQPGSFSVVDARGDTGRCSHHRDEASPSHVITSRTLFSEHGAKTEALHAMPGGVLVSTFPLEPAAEAKATLHTARFTRTLRTPASKAATQSIMERDAENKADGGAG